MDTTFEQYVTERGPGLVRFAGALTGDPGTAEELVQEVLLRASRRWPDIVATGAVHAYLRRMVINEHVSWRRKWARLVPHGDVPDEGLADEAIAETLGCSTGTVRSHASRTLAALRIDLSRSSSTPTGPPFAHRHRRLAGRRARRLPGVRRRGLRGRPAQKPMSKAASRS